MTAADYEAADYEAVIEDLLKAMSKATGFPVPVFVEGQSSRDELLAYEAEIIERYKAAPVKWAK